MIKKKLFQSLKSLQKRTIISTVSGLKKGVNSFDVIGLQTKIARRYFKENPNLEMEKLSNAYSTEFIPETDSSHQEEFNEYHQTEKKKVSKRIAHSAWKLFYLSIIFLTSCLSLIKIFHHFRLYDKRKKIHFSNSMITAMKLLESSIRINYSMYFMTYHLVDYIILKNYLLKIRKLKPAKRGDFGELLEEETEYDKIMNKFYEKAAKRSRNLLQNLGGLFIKAGQEFSMVPGLPKPFLEELSKLCDNVKPCNWEDIESLFYEEFEGKELEDIFEGIDGKELSKTPIAAASLAQVYKWRLKETGEVTAVKVQYPLANYYIDGDILLQSLGMKFLSIFSSIYKDMSETSKEGMKMLKKELDFENEAMNQMQCYENFKNSKNITVPKVFEKYSTNRIITMEWKDGVKPNDIEGIKRLGFTNKQVAEGLFTAFGEMIFKNGNVHGDLHAGNILISKKKGLNEPEINILDHGMYMKIPEKRRLENARFWKAMILGDKEYMQKYCESIGIKDYKLYVTLMLMQNYEGVMNDQMHSNNGKINFKQWEESGKSYKNLSKKEKKAEEEKWKNLFTNMPKENLGILRSSFILSFINGKLGAPLNRFSLMARIAAKHSVEKDIEEEEESKISVGSFFKNNYELFKFELRLKINEFKAIIVKHLVRFYFTWIKLSEKLKFGNNNNENEDSTESDQLQAMGPDFMQGFQKRYEI